MKNRKAELEKELDAIIKTLKLHEAILRREIRELHTDVRHCSRTTFSDPRVLDDGALDVLNDGVQKILEAGQKYIDCRRESRKFYDANIKKGRKPDGLKCKRIAGIDFIFPNI